MMDISFVNKIENIARNPKVTAINSCIEVDITGQVVSDSIGNRIYSGKYQATCGGLMFMGWCSPFAFCFTN